MTRLLLVFLLLLNPVWLLLNPLWAQDDPAPAYAKAVTAFNAGRFSEARDRMAALLAKHSDFFRGYDLYWNAIGRSEGEAARKDAILKALPRFESAAESARNEDYFQSYRQACVLLGRTDRLVTLQRDELAKFPKGAAAKKFRLDQARNEPDAVKAAALYQAYADDFSEDLVLSQQAAWNRFALMAEYSGKFDPGAVEAAGEDVESRTRKLASKFADPYRYVVEMELIAQRLAPKNPAASLAFARKALAYIQDNWNSSADFQESERYRLWPAMIDAYVSKKDWGAAIKLGSEFVRARNLGLISTRLVTEEQEVSARRRLAEALEKNGDRLLANEQLQIADGVSKGLFHKLRERQELATLRALRIRMKAPAFTLTNLDGSKTSLDQFRGRPVILAFWATWCAPCRPELKELQALRDRINAKAAIVAVSIRSEHSNVASFVAELGLSLPVLFGNRAVETAYDAQTLPKIYVIDANGNISYQLNSYESDGNFQARLEWMLDDVQAGKAEFTSK